MPGDETATSSPGQHKRDVPLPKVTVDSMSKAELKELIPRLMKLVTGREDIWHSRRSGKPKWWPADVKWASSNTDWISQKYRLDKLRAVVWNCYRYMHKEELLCDADIDESPKIEEAKLYTPVSGNMSPVKSVAYPSRQVRESLAGIFLPFSTEIYICYFCEREFISKDEMRSHQRQCDHRPPQLHRCLSSPRPPTANIQADPPDLSPKPHRKITYPAVSRQKFVGYLDLLPEQKAAKLVHERCSVEVNCDVLDDVFEPHSPTTPLSPRTPKSLISQLSREDPSQLSKKRLSYSLSVDKGKLDSSDDDTDSDSDVERKPPGAVKEKVNFLNIDISSPLGQRIQKHVHVDTPVAVVDFRTFCKTPVKNCFLEKLRKKPLSYPVVYRPRRVANLHKQRHLYKFTRRQRRQFMAHINTGLTEQSRTLLRQMRRLGVGVVGLTRPELLKYIPAEILDRQLRGLPVERGRVLPKLVQCDFPPGPTLLVRNVDKLLGLKKRSAGGQEQTPLSLGNVISEDMEAELSKQKLTLYRSLLYEMSLIASPKVVVKDLGLRKQTTGETNTSRNDTSSVVEGLHNDSPSKLIDHPATTSEVSASGDSSLIAGNEYQVLKSMLTGRTVVMLSPGSSQPCPATVLPENPEESPSKDRSRTDLDSTFSSPDSASAYCGMCNRKSPNVQFSPGDDSISIISEASEDISFQSNCCQGCSMKKHDRSMLTHNISKHNTPPLSVNVENEVKFSSRTEMTYGVPSPVSVDGESPLQMMHTKSDEMPMCSSVENDLLDEKMYPATFPTSVTPDQTLTAHLCSLIRGDTVRNSDKNDNLDEADICIKPKQSNILYRPTRSSSLGLPDVFTQAELNKSIHRKILCLGSVDGESHLPMMPTKSDEMPMCSSVDNDPLGDKMYPVTFKTSVTPDLCLIRGDTVRNSDKNGNFDESDICVKPKQSNILYRPTRSSSLDLPDVFTQAELNKSVVRYTRSHKQTPTSSPWKLSMMPTKSDEMPMCSSVDNDPLGDKIYPVTFPTRVAPDQCSLISGYSVRNSDKNDNFDESDICVKPKQSNILYRPTRSSSLGLPDVFTQAELNKSVLKSPSAPRYTRPHEQTPTSSPWKLSMMPTKSDEMPMCSSVDNDPLGDKIYPVTFPTRVAPDQCSLISGYSVRNSDKNDNFDESDICVKPKQSNILYRPTRSSSLGLPDVFTQAELNKSVLKSPSAARYTRPHEQTPTSSPWKLRTMSLPSTPQSTSSPLVKRHIFRGVKLLNKPSPLSSSSFNDKFCTQTPPKSGSVRDKTNSALKLQILSSTPKTYRPSPREYGDTDASNRVNKSLSVLSMNKDVGMKRETRSTSISESRGIPLSLGRKKRLSSVLQGLKPTKLRKVYSDMALPTR